MAQIFKFTSQKAKEHAIYERLKCYHETVNGNSVSIPAWQAAKADLDRIKENGMINFCYRRMLKNV